LKKPNLGFETKEEKTKDYKKELYLYSTKTNNV